MADDDSPSGDEGDEAGNALFEKSGAGSSSPDDEEF